MSYQEPAKLSTLVKAERETTITYNSDEDMAYISTTIRTDQKMLWEMMEAGQPVILEKQDDYCMFFRCPIEFIRIRGFNKNKGISKPVGVKA